MCLLLAFITKYSRAETIPEIQNIFSKQNEAHGTIEGPDQQSSIEISENIAYSTVEQQPQLPQLITPPIYETIN